MQVQHSANSNIFFILVVFVVFGDEVMDLIG